MTNMSIFKIAIFLTFIAGCLQNERNVKPCRSYDPHVLCPPIYMRHVSVCYEWKWDYFGWVSSSTSLICNGTRILIHCKHNCLNWLPCGRNNYTWVESLPECQQSGNQVPISKVVTQAQSTNTLSSNASTVLQSSDLPVSKVVTQAQSANTLSSNASTVLQSSDLPISKVVTQAQSTNTLSSNASTVLQSSDLPISKVVTQAQSASTLSSNASTVLQSSDVADPPSTTPVVLNTHNQLLGAQDDDKQNLLAVYVAVPTVIVVCAIALLLLKVLRRRKQWTQGITCHTQAGEAAIDNRQIHAVTNNAYDPDVVSSTVVGVLRVDDGANDYNTTNQQTAVNSTDDFSNYDHLGNNDLSAVNSTYSSTSQVEARDTYCHTITTLSRHSDPPYDKAGNVALTQISEETKIDTN